MSQQSTASAARSGASSFWVRAVISVALGIAILGIGVAGAEKLKSLKEPPKAREPVEKVYNVDVLPIARVNLWQPMTAHGTAMPERDETISAEVTGRVLLTSAEGELLKVGQRVANKQLLVGIDPTTYKQRYEQADLIVKADVEEYNRTLKEQSNNRVLVKLAQADRDAYQQEYQRFVNAKARGAADDSQVNQARLELQRYENALALVEHKQSLFPLQLKQIAIRRQQHEKDREIAKTEWDRSMIRATFDGIITEVHVQPGKYVKVGDPLVRISSKAVVEIPMALAYDDYVRLAPLVRKSESLGSKPEVKLSTGEEQPFQWSGRVVRVSPFADELTRTVKVFVRVVNHPSSTPVLPGMHYHGVITGPRLDQVIVVPRDAIIGNRVFVAADLKKATVMLGDEKFEVLEGVARPREVKISQTLRGLAVIEDGLKKGEQLILTNLDVLYDGAKVHIRREQVRNLDKELKPFQPPQ